MRILHTSDWHVGKRLMSRERLDEQAKVLDEIASICQTEQIELVLVAGDIFDTYTPSAEAEELFYDKIKKIVGEDRSALIISGNHDDGVRLSAIAPLSHTQGIYVVGNARSPITTQQMSTRLAYPIRSGKGYVEFENQRGERAFIATLPYPNEARFREEKSDLPYVERMQGWIREGMSGNEDGSPAVLLAHIFVAGGVVSDGEREIDLGGARAIPVRGLPKCAYIALGHLHKKQRLGDNVYYSGSPLQYSFDESADKSVKVFDLTANGVENLRDIPLTSGKKLIRLQAADVDGATALLQTYPDCLVELKLTLSSPLTGGESARLAAYENLVSLLAEVRTDETLQLQSRKGLSDEELFDAFYQASYDAPPKAELKTLFLETLNQLNEQR